MNILPRYHLLLPLITIVLSSMCFIPLTSSHAAEQGINYKPPVNGTPARRIAAGSRGTCDNIKTLSPKFSLHTLAPDTVGYTLNAQPTLYWFLSEDVKGKFNLSIQPYNTESMEEETVLIDENLLLDVKAGIQSLDLSRFSIKLEKGVEYEWFLSLVCNDENRSQDIVANGMIKRIAPSPQLTTHLNTVEKSQLAFSYAQYSLWYDAVDVLSHQIAQQPNNNQLVDVRSHLLRQGGLPENVSALN